MGCLQSSTGVPMLGCCDEGPPEAEATSCFAYLLLIQATVSRNGNPRRIFLSTRQTQTQISGAPLTDANWTKISKSNKPAPGVSVGTFQWLGPDGVTPAGHDTVDLWNSGNFSGTNIVIESDTPTGYTASFDEDFGGGQIVRFRYTYEMYDEITDGDIRDILIGIYNSFAPAKLQEPLAGFQVIYVGTLVVNSFTGLYEYSVIGTSPFGEGLPQAARGMLGIPRSDPTAFPGGPGNALAWGFTNYDQNLEISPFPHSNFPFVPPQPGENTASLWVVRHIASARMAFPHRGGPLNSAPWCEMLSAGLAHTDGTPPPIGSEICWRTRTGNNDFFTLYTEIPDNAVTRADWGFSLTNDAANHLPTGCPSNNGRYCACLSQTLVDHCANMNPAP